VEISTAKPEATDTAQSVTRDTISTALKPSAWPLILSARPTLTIIYAPAATQDTLSIFKETAPWRME